MTLLITGSTIFLAAAFRGLTGFGYALIAAIGLSAFLAPDSMVPLILVCDLVLTGLILANRKQGPVDWAIAPALLTWGFLGALCGGLLAASMDPVTTKLLVAATVCLAALVAMVHKPPHWLAHRYWGWSAAFAVGVLLAAFAVGGPLIAVWLLAGGTKRETTRGTLALFFGAVDLFSLVGRTLVGQINDDLGLLLLTYLPLSVAGYFVGTWIGGHLSLLLWRRLSALGLILIAVTGAAQTIIGLG